MMKIKRKIYSISMEKLT